MHSYFFKKTQELKQRGGLFVRATSTGMLYFSYCDDYMHAGSIENNKWLVHTSLHLFSHLPSLWGVVLS